MKTTAILERSVSTSKDSEGLVTYYVRSQRKTFFVVNKTIPEELIGKEVEVTVEEYTESLPFEGDMKSQYVCNVLRDGKKVTLKVGEIIKKGDVVVYNKPRREATIGNNFTVISAIKAMSYQDAKLAAISVSKTMQVEEEVL